MCPSAPMNPNALASGVRLITYKVKIPPASTSAPGRALLNTNGINLPLTRCVLGCIERTNEGTALMNISYIIILFVVKKYALPVKMQVRARVKVKKVFII